LDSPLKIIKFCLKSLRKRPNWTFKDNI
jgi:hypothetical protein